MKAQRERARAARKDSTGMAVQSEVLSEIDVTSTYVGYDQLVVETRVNTIVSGDAFVSAAEAGDEVYLVAEQTPFQRKMVSAQQLSIPRPQLLLPTLMRLLTQWYSRAFLRLIGRNQHKLMSRQFHSTLQ